MNPKWVLILGLLVACTAGASAELYRSNAVGIRGERLVPGEESPEYVLDVTSSGNTEIRELLKDGEPIQRTEITRDGSSVTERVFEGEQIQRETVRKSDGTIQQETLYADGEITERSDYGYSNNRLATRTVTDSSGNLRFVEQYSYWRDGTLRSIVKEDASETRTEYRYKDGRLEEEWVSRSERAERFEFDPAGRLVIRELFENDDLLEQEVRIYWGSDSASLLKQVVVGAGDDITKRDYDERGRLVRETVEQSGTIVRVLDRTFEGDLLVAETEKDSDGTRSWKYDYDGEDRIRTSYYEDDQIIEITSYRLDESDLPATRMTELYNRGEPVLRIYYEGENRIREDVIRDGVVIRSRAIGGDS